MQAFLNVSSSPITDKEAFVEHYLARRRPGVPTLRILLHPRLEEVLLTKTGSCQD